MTELLFNLNHRKPSNMVLNNPLNFPIYIFLNFCPIKLSVYVSAVLIINITCLQVEHSIELYEIHLDDDFEKSTIKNCKPT